MSAELWSTEDVARLAQVDPKTVYKMVRRHKLPEPVRIDGRCWWEPDDLRYWLIRRIEALVPVGAPFSRPDVLDHIDNLAAAIIDAEAPGA